MTATSSSSTTRPPIEIDRTAIKFCLGSHHVHVYRSDTPAQIEEWIRVGTDCGDDVSLQTIILEVGDAAILGVLSAVHVDQGISTATFDVLGKLVGGR